MTVALPRVTWMAIDDQGIPMGDHGMCVVSLGMAMDLYGLATMPLPWVAMGDHGISMDDRSMSMVTRGYGHGSPRRTGCHGRPWHSYG